VKSQRAKRGKAGQKQDGSPARKISRRPVLSSQFMEDLQYWIETDRKVSLRLLDLMNECLRTPMEGKGKPEALKRKLGGMVVAPFD
jgi:hypothetical protein